MKLLFLYLLTSMMLFASEPIVPTVGFSDAWMSGVLSNSGKTFLYVNDKQKIAINLNDWSYTRITGRHPLTSERFFGNEDYFIGFNGTKLNLYNATDPSRSINSKRRNYNFVKLGGPYLFGYAEQNNSIEVLSFPKFEVIATMKLPKEMRLFRPSTLVSEDTISVRGRTDKKHFNFLFDIATETFIKSDALEDYKVQWLFNSGAYLIATPTRGGASAVFNTKTFQRDRVLEKYLVTKPEITYISDYNAHQVLIVSGTDIYIWDIAQQKETRSFKLPKKPAKVMHQGDTLAMYSYNQPLSILNLSNGTWSILPYVKRTIYGMFMQNGQPKALIPFGEKRVGIWNLLEHRLEQLAPDIIPQEKLNKAIKAGRSIYFQTQSDSMPLIQWRPGDKNATRIYSEFADEILVDSDHSLLMARTQTSLQTLFRLYNTKSGNLLHTFKAPDRYPEVYKMRFSEDGKQFFAYTANYKGHYRSCWAGIEFDYDHNASIYQWNLTDKSFKLLPNSSAPEPCRLYKSDEIRIENENIEVFWNDKNGRIELSRKDNPFRTVYLYIPQNSSEWFDIDNFGFFDASEHGADFLYGCREDQCKHLDDSAIRYFKRPGMLKNFLNMAF